MGAAEGHPDSPSVISQRPDLTTLGLARRRRARRDGRGRACDIDVAEIYDCFTFTVLCEIGGPRVLQQGRRGPFVEGGATALGGRLPVNTHGGLLSQAHMAGLNHVVELVRQLRGEGGATQVPDAEIGLVTGLATWATDPWPSCGEADAMATEAAAKPCPSRRAIRSRTGTA